jgi:hypothetical protein
MGDKVVLRLDWIQETAERVAEIRQQMLATHSRHKSYADSKRLNVEFQMGEKANLRMSPIKGVLRFVSHESLLHNTWDLS